MGIYGMFFNDIQSEQDVASFVCDAAEFLHN